MSGETFPVLGLKPVVGRLLTAAGQSRPDCPSPGVVLSHAYWQREFGGAPSVLQQTVRLEGARFDIIGVTPPDFFGLEVGRRFDVAVPLCANPIPAVRFRATRVTKGLVAVDQSDGSLPAGPQNTGMIATAGLRRRRNHGGHRAAGLPSGR